MSFVPSLNNIPSGWGNRVPVPQEMRDILYRISTEYNDINKNYAFMFKVNQWSSWKVIPADMCYGQNAHRLDSFQFVYRGATIHIENIYGSGGANWYK